MSYAEVHLEYIKNVLIAEIVAKLGGERVLSYELDNATGLDGFMSALYTINLKTQGVAGDVKERLIIAKFMRGDDDFRISSKSYTQFANEIFAYAEILPSYERLLQEAGVHNVSINDWVPTAYVAKFGQIEGLSNTPTTRESVLVLKHLKPDGYRLGPRLHLRRDQLLALCKPVAQFHATGYALRIRHPKEFERLKAGIVPLKFRNPENPRDSETNGYNALFRVAFDRFFDFCDRKLSELTDINKPADAKLLVALSNLKKKYFADPTNLLENLRTQVEHNVRDSRFAVILHGDYNRNNVLFHFKSTAADGDKVDTNAEVDDVKMIDFQELRYGTPCIDLSFYMYMNTPPELREEMWSKLLHTYHQHMCDMLKKVLASITTENELARILTDYNFENFERHFERYAFYGVMICLHFMPWLLCTEEECAEISHLFETDMHGAAFHKISIEAGGDAVNLQIFDVVRHACKMGYMDFI